MSETRELHWPLTRDCQDTLAVRVSVSALGTARVEAALNGLALPGMPSVGGGVGAYTFPCRGQSYELRWLISELDGSCVAVALKARGHLIGQWGDGAAIARLFDAKVGATWRSLAVAAVAIPFRLALMVGIVLLLGRLTQVGTPGRVGPGLPTPFTAHFVVEEVSINDDCAELLNYCVNVVCAVRNDGGAGGLSTVEATMFQPGRPSVTRSQSIRVDARGLSSARFRFPEAERFGNVPRGECAIRQ